MTRGGSGADAYIAALPYMFYSWISLAVVLLVIFGVIPMLGVTKKHARIAAEQGIVCPPEASYTGEAIQAPDFESILAEMKERRRIRGIS